MNQNSNGRAIKRVNRFKRVALVLSLLAILTVCLQPHFRYYKDPDYWNVRISFLPHSYLEVFSGELSGTGYLYSVITMVSDDSFTTQQQGAVYQNGKWEFLK